MKRYLLMPCLLLLMIGSSAAATTLSMTTTTCPSGTQGSAYSGCTLVATGGTAPYTFSVDSDATYAPLPEGLSLNASTGLISSSQIGGQGGYTVGLIVTDSASATAENYITFLIQGNNTFAENIFPSNSIFHHRVDYGTTLLPVDTSPAAPIGDYSASAIYAFFSASYLNYPNGTPLFEVPCNQSNVNVSTTVYQSYFTSGPIPPNAPVQASAGARNSGDRHVLIYQQAGCGNPAALHELYTGVFEGSPCTGMNCWTDVSNALWSNTGTNALTPQGMGTSDAGGLPVSILQETADEVIGTGTADSPNGAPQHPIGFTVNLPASYWVWPATDSSTAYGASCLNGSGGTISAQTQLSQVPTDPNYPASCSHSLPFGEIYRLKASVSTPSCANTSPQAAIIITQLRNYGIMMDDGGTPNGTLDSTPDPRWDAAIKDCLANFHLSDFEPVNVSSLIVSNDSGQSGPGPGASETTIGSGVTLGSGVTVQ